MLTTYIKVVSAIILTILLFVMLVGTIYGVWAVHEMRAVAQAQIEAMQQIGGAR